MWEMEPSVLSVLEKRMWFLKYYFLNFLTVFIQFWLFKRLNCVMTKPVTDGPNLLYERNVLHHLCAVSFVWYILSLVCITLHSANLWQTSIRHGATARLPCYLIRFHLRTSYGLAVKSNAVGVGGIRPNWNLILGWGSNYWTSVFSL